MDRSDVLTLISVTYQQDDYGIEQPTETTNEIYCRTESVTRAEFYDAGRNGLNPELKFVVFCGDYDGQKLLEYDGKRYSVVRTYQRKNDDLELYAERKGGTNA